MTTRPPPKLATALLQHFGPNDHALVGDLNEGFVKGRTRTWYWRQVLGAVTLNSVRELREHPLLVLRTILIGWGMVWFTTTLIGFPLSGAIRSWILPRLIIGIPFRPLVALWLLDSSSYPPIAIMYALAGWIVGHLHRPSSGVVITFGLTVLVAGIVESTAVPDTPMRYAASFVIWRTAIPTIFVLLGGLWTKGNNSAGQPAGSL